MKNKNIQERTYDYSIKIIHLVDIVPKDIVTDVITKQLLRSATSIGANINEAQASSSRKDFTNFINHSLKSANESIDWLNLLKDSVRVNSDNLESLLKETKEIANILGASLLTLRKKT